MSTIISFNQMTDTEIQAFANNVKNLLLDRLCVNNMLKDPDKLQDLKENYLVVVSKKGFFGRLYDKIFHPGEEKNVLTFHLVKIV